MQGKIALIALPSAEKIGRRVNQILSEWRNGEEFLIPVDCPRFSSGEAISIIIYNSRIVITSADRINRWCCRICIRS